MTLHRRDGAPHTVGSIAASAGSHPSNSLPGHDRLRFEELVMNSSTCTEADHARVPSIGGDLRCPSCGNRLVTGWSPARSTCPLDPDQRGDMVFLDVNILQAWTTMT
jgi:hypothetical protein